MGSKLESTDAKNKLEDLSGIVYQPGENPYEALINACNGRPEEIQSLYSTHRTTRNAQQRSRFLSPDFQECIIDPFLLRLENRSIEPGFQDPRNCLVFWARPPEHVIQLAVHLQNLLKEAAPSLWLMPAHRMHMTTLEITHSRTPAEISGLVESMRPVARTVTDLTFTRRSRLVKPLLSYDLAAIALTFLPASGEAVVSRPIAAPPHTADGVGKDGVVAWDEYTYHHLRRGVFEMVKDTYEVQSRYVVPSAHITLGRYLCQDDHDTPQKREAWIDAIEGINKWLETQVWDAEGGGWIGEWIVGQERGLDFRCGALWYGGGRTVMLGEGF
ncbi:RNA ligase/cyclic nucleotide phosphodiesterase [Diplogelasinospora grovesii]|uniref:RNA ligase/cyclic nucleotide phosphodiesterase n=1 Tax=Diplogelasinospora grovesii TaxID=303347 RepID=A0AAN6N375_9PEZI|nr:RNA ligase/cyclic nucleotide phosphodiesterase [Diplogelasinospora grovesii]